MQYLSIADILEIHSVIIDETGGSHGVRDRGAITTLDGLPRQHAFGVELYRGVFMKGAVYIRNIIFSHPFVDGNKRTAITAADVFLQLNGYAITAPKGEVEAFTLAVIAKHLELNEIEAWLKKYSRRSRL